MITLMEKLKRLLKEYPTTLLASLSSIPVSYILSGWYHQIYEKVFSGVSQELITATLIAVGMLLVLVLSYLYDLRKRVIKLDRILNENIKLKTQISQIDPGEISDDVISVLGLFGSSSSGSLTTSWLCQNLDFSPQRVQYYIDVLINKNLIFQEDPFDFDAGDYGLTHKGRAYLNQRGLI